MNNRVNLRLLSALAIIGATSASSAGCLVHARGSGSASGEADAPVTYVSRPTLVAVGSGVWVVRGSAHAAYYVNDSYWVYRDDVWYRSSRYDGGWVVVQASVVPSVCVNLKHSMYVNYQGSAAAETRLAPGGNDSAEKKEDKAEKKEDKAEKKEDKAEKKEDKAEKKEDKAEKKDGKAEKKDDKKKQK